MSTVAALIIFVKEPVPGKVKTRLAASIGNKAALEIYERLLGHTDHISSGFKRFIFYSGNPAMIEHFNKEEDTWIEQHDGDLGKRIAVAFNHVFDSGHHSAIIIGSDCAQLTADGIQHAVDGVEQGNTVLGPALDGGYYLLGLTKPSPQLFADMPWSTADVAQITRDRIIVQGEELMELPVLRDVDHEEDLNAIGWSIRSV